jgi:putative flippase GtrA
MARHVADLYGRVRHLVPELAKFGIVGGIGTVVDLGGAAVLHSKYHMGPLTAKGISISAAAVITYLGSRFWTFRHRENQPLLREGMLFLAFNVVGLLLAEAVIACTTYVLGYKDPIAYNVASLVGTGLGTIFRFFAYRKWVFLAPATQEPAAVPEPAARAPWEPMDWTPPPAPAHAVWPVRPPRSVRLQNSVIPNGAVATPMATAPAPAWPPAPAWQPVPASQTAPAFQPAPTFHAAAWFQAAPAFQPAPGFHQAAPSFQAAPAWEPAASTRPAARPDPAGPRSPGRHRKR